MKRARVPFIGVLSVGAAALFAACSSSSGVGNSSDGGGDGRGPEAGADVHEEMFSFDQGSDVPATDSSHDSPGDHVSEETPDGNPDVVPDGPLDGPVDAPFDAPDLGFDVIDEVFPEDVSDVVFFEDGGFDVVSSEDVFDSPFCTLPDGSASEFPSMCASCLEESCCAQLTACDADPGCKAIADCIGLCLTKGKTNCSVTCYDAADAGKNLGSELINCMNDECNGEFEMDCE